MSNEDFTKLNRRIDDLEKRVSGLEAKKGADSDDLPASKKKLSLREFLILKKPSDDVKKALAIGYYLEKFDGLTSFNADDLETSFEKAKEKKPPNRPVRTISAKISFLTLT